MKFQALSGMRDYIGTSGEDLSDLTRIARGVFDSAGFREIQTPIMEDATLFDRSLGSDTDVVSKEMYTVEQSEDRLIALRPENTAGVVRAVIQHQLMPNRNQLKVYYAGPMFRHERPQSGRMRQFHQVGLEVFGREDPLCDAEVIQLADDYLRRCDVGDLTLLLNSIGCPRCRPGYLEELVESVRPHTDELCEDCRRRMETNPLRMLDCKNSDCRTVYERHAPSILDALCSDCEPHFETVQRYLNEMKVPFTIDDTLVRGLDYYRRTTFEFVSGGLGSQNAVLAGGRYDGLVEELGGEPCPGIGFAAGLERMMLLRGTLDSQDVDTRADCFLVAFNEEAATAALPLVQTLRDRSIPGPDRPMRVEMGRPGDSLRAQLRRANRYGARFALLLGDEEMNEGTITLKRMDTGDQESVEFPPAERVGERIEATWDQVDPESLQI